MSRVHEHGSPTPGGFLRLPSGLSGAAYGRPTVAGGQLFRPCPALQTLPGQTWRVVRGLPRSSQRLTACRRRLIMKTIGGYGLPKIN